ncbi:hypothetical protein [Streptomyces sp. NBC_00987]|nr:hypothetical protein OG355_41260 [Streptomyces sp. NBC_00987]
MTEPAFIHHPTTPPDVKPTSFQVYTDGAPEGLPRAPHQLGA